MKFSRFLAVSLTVVGLLTMGAKCGDAQGDSRIGNGMVLGKSNYGLWRATTASSDCRWRVTKKNKLLASGGQYDMVISGTGLKGGVLHTSHCGWFYK